MILCIYYTIYIYVYIYGTPKKNRRFWGRNAFGTNYPVQFEFQWGVYYIYIQLYTYVCINCCLTVETKYLEQFCQQKRLQTSPGAQVLSGFKIQDSKKTSWIQKLLAPGFKTYFLALESWILNPDQQSFWIQEVFCWILNHEPVSFANVCKRFWWQNCSKYLPFLAFCWCQRGSICWEPFAKTK